MLKLCNKSLVLAKSILKHLNSFILGKKFCYFKISYAPKLNLWQHYKYHIFIFIFIIEKYNF